MFIPVWALCVVAFWICALTWQNDRLLSVYKKGDSDEN